MTPATVILGIGNLLRSDDGVGVHAVRALALDPPAGADVVDAGTDVLSTLPFLERAAYALIIDAVRSGRPPGTFRTYTASELAPRPDTPTAHAVNVLAGRHLLPPGHAWPELLVLGVEPSTLDYGTSLSPAVAAALPHLVSRCREIVAGWNPHRVTP